MSVAMVSDATLPKARTARTGHDLVAHGESNAISASPNATDEAGLAATSGRGDGAAPDQRARDAPRGHRRLRHDARHHRPHQLRHLRRHQHEQQHEHCALPQTKQLTHRRTTVTHLVWPV